MMKFGWPESVSAGVSGLSGVRPSVDRLDPDVLHRGDVREALEAEEGLRAAPRPPCARTGRPCPRRTVQVICAAGTGMSPPSCSRTHSGPVSFVPIFSMSQAVSGLSGCEHRGLPRRPEMRILELDAPALERRSPCSGLRSPCRKGGLDCSSAAFEDFDRGGSSITGYPPGTSRPATCAPWRCRARRRAA